VIRTVLAGLFLLAAWRFEASAAADSAEYQVKAAFLFNFTKYVEWPSNAFSGANSPFIIGIVGKDPFGGQMEKTLEGKTVDGHGFTVRRYRQPADIGDCHVLFISDSEKDRVGRILAKVGDSPTLTVSDIGNFARLGGAIGFVVEDERVRFDINTEAAQHAGLKISSRLLALAKSVRP
jgi:hypothetical protein